MRRYTAEQKEFFRTFIPGRTEMFVDDYEPEPVRPGRVDKEGDYERMRF